MVPLVGTLNKQGRLLAGAQRDCSMRMSVQCNWAAAVAAAGLLYLPNSIYSWVRNLG